MIGINWCECQTIINPEFIDSQLDYSVFQGLNLTKVKFDRSSLCEVDFSDANITKASFCDTILKNAQFLNANLSEADLRGARDYFIDVRATKVKKAKFSMPEAMALFDPLEIIVE